MIDTTFLLALGLVFISLIVILGIAQEAAMQRHRDEVISTAFEILDAKAREAQADGMVLVWTGSSKAHEEANHAIEEIIC